MEHNRAAGRTTGKGEQVMKPVRKQKDLPYTGQQIGIGFGARVQFIINDEKVSVDQFESHTGRKFCRECDGELVTNTYTDHGYSTPCRKRAKLLSERTPGGKS